MTGRYPVEALLRPPVELYSALVAMRPAVARCSRCRRVFLMTPTSRVASRSRSSVSRSCAVARGAGRFAISEIFAVCRVTSCRSRRIPISTTRLFLGRGISVDAAAHAALARHVAP